MGCWAVCGSQESGWEMYDPHVTDEAWQAYLEIARQYDFIFDAPTEELEKSIHSICAAVENYQLADTELLDALDYLDVLLAELKLRYRRKGIRGAGGIAV